LARPAVTDCAAYLNLWFNSSQHGQQYFSECIYGAGRPTSASISSAPRLSRCLRSGSSSRSLPGSIGCSQLRTTYRTASTLRRVVLSEAHRQSSRRPSAETLSHEAYLTMETGNRPKLCFPHLPIETSRTRSDLRQTTNGDRSDRPPDPKIVTTLSHAM
jgi:hypothetical protein